MRLMEYGSFVVDAPDADARYGIRAMPDDELAAAREAGQPVDAVVFPAEIDPKPYADPDRYTVYNTHVIGMHGLKAALEVKEEGQALLTIDTVPPIKASGILVRLNPQNYRNARRQQLTFVPHQDFDKATRALRDQRVDV